jgi:hypothetical protein
MLPPPPLTSARKEAAGALLVGSLVLLAGQLWNIALWSRAVDRGQSQEARLALYLSYLPGVLGQLGATGLTWLAIGCAGAAGLLSGGSMLLSRGWARWLAGAVLGLNLLLECWYLFSLM